MSGNSVAPMSKVAMPAPSARRRIDVKTLFSGHLQPFKIVEGLKNALALAREYRARYGRDVNGKLYMLREDQNEDERIELLLMAVDLRDALPSKDAIGQAYAALLRAIQVPFDEPSARLLIGIMCDVMPGKPGEGAPVYLDAMIFSIEEFRLEHHQDITAPAAAIAAAAREAWESGTFRPSIHEFLGLVSKHWHRLIENLNSVAALGKFVATLEEITPNINVHSPSQPGTEGKDGDNIPF
jgi:hypothetical protein